MTERVEFFVRLPRELAEHRPPRHIFLRAFRHGLDIARLMQNWKAVAEYYRGSETRTVCFYVPLDLKAEFDRIVSVHEVCRRHVAIGAMHYALVESHSLGFNKAFAERHQIPEPRRVA